MCDSKNEESQANREKIIFMEAKTQEASRIKERLTAFIQMEKRMETISSITPPREKGGCVHSLYVALTKEKQLEKRTVCLVYSSGGRESTVAGKACHHGSRSQKKPSPYPRNGKQKWEPGYKNSKPTSRDMLPPGWPRLLRLTQLSQSCNNKVILDQAGILNDN